MKKTIIAALIAASMTTNAGAITLNKAHEQAQACYFPQAYTTTAKAEKHMEKLDGNAAVWLTGCNTKTRCISLDLPNGKWKTEKENGAVVDWTSRTKGKCIVGVDKSGYAVLKNGNKRVLIAAKTRCKDYICDADECLTAVDEWGGNLPHRLHAGEGMNFSVSTTKAGDRLNISWTPAKLADSYRLLISDPTEERTAYKRPVDGYQADIAEPDAPYILHVQAEHHGAFGAIWRKAGAER